jgi:integrase
LSVEKDLGSQTRLHVYNLLNRMFEDAIHHYEILKYSPVKTKFKPEVQRTERSFLKPDEAMKLLSHSRTHYLGPAIWLALLSGLRVEAIQGLQVSSLDFAAQQILVKDAYKRKIKKLVSMPKGKSWEYVPMPLALVDYLRELQSKQKPSSSDFVASGKDGGMLNYRVLLYGVKRLCREVEVPEVTPHELRHSCTELYMRFGQSNIEDIRRLLNHKTDACTVRYIHRTNDKLQLAAQKVGQAVNDRLFRKPLLAVANGNASLENLEIED